MLASIDAVVAQLQKGNAPLDKLVFELTQKIAKSREFVKGFEIGVSNLEEKKNML